MNSYEFELWIAEYKSQIKKAGAERPLKDSEIEKLEENIDFIPDEYKSAFTLALGRDFSKFEKLPHLLRNFLGALEVKSFIEKFDNAPSLANKEVRDYLEAHAMNAALRAGISALKNAESTRESAMTLDAYMNNILMKRTLLPPTEEAKKSLAQHLNSESQAEAIIQRSKATQLVMAKAMLLAQIGKYDVIDKNGFSKDLNVPVYETLVHGNRTNFVLPDGENSGSVIDAFMGQDGGAAAGIEKRTAATHSVKLRSFDKNGIVKSESKEERTYSPLKIFGNQFGMDIAAGGVGTKGPNKELIIGNGESGHMYMRAEEGDSKHCGSLLIGIEGSAPGSDSYLGNTHGIRAKSAKQSAFLADKSIVGKKVGGRQIDLTGISAEDLTNVLDQFSEKYSELQNAANTPEGREKISAVNDMLMGERMDINKIMDMFASLGMTDKGLTDIISNARRGYLSRIDAKSITDEEFKQSIRAKFSQEQACDIAKARFEYANDSLELAAGAIKELMFTHETRSLGWKIRHPIKNYRENKTISDLISKLEKDFDPADIASAFGYYDDSFALNWGEKLSNDRDAIRFTKENRLRFKEPENRMLGVLKQVYDKFSEKVGDTNVAEAEASRMHDELSRIEMGKELDDSRESIVIEEENENNKSTDLDVSDVIIPKQPILDNKKEL